MNKIAQTFAHKLIIHLHAHKNNSRDIFGLFYTEAYFLLLLVLWSKEKHYHLDNEYITTVLFILECPGLQFPRFDTRFQNGMYSLFILKSDIAVFEKRNIKRFSHNLTLTKKHWL